MAAAATAAPVEETPRIDQLLTQVERLYKNLTGNEPPEAPLSAIPPEKNPGEHIEAQLERLLGALSMGPEMAQQPAWMPALTVTDSGNELVVMVDLPGVRRDDLRVSSNGRVLELSGQRQLASAGPVRMTERPFGPFRRTVLLPADAQVDQMSAHLADGVLTIRLTRAEVRPIAVRQVPLD
jgi:HSP20 family protein